MVFSPHIGLWRKSVCIFFFIFAVFFSSCGSSGEEEILTDDDVDGIWDVNDPYPGDTDNDGLPNETDNDDDNDGIRDSDDAFPFDPREYLDTDHDGTGNNADADDDGDGIPDQFDAFPLTADEWEDTDLDLVGNNNDTDDDGDGCPDISDLFPQDPAKWGDHDSDGIDSVNDLDDDNDGYLDGVETAENSNPFDPASRPVDSDADGLTDRQESAFGSNPYITDSDGDALNDKLEFALGTDPNSADSDGDGIDDLTEVGPDLNNVHDFDKDGIIDARDYYLLFDFRNPESDPQETNDRFGISSDGDGNIYVANYEDSKIYIYNNSGQFMREISADGFLHPNDISIGNDDMLFVADTHNNRIVVMDFSGNVDEIFEHQPDGLPGGFIAPMGLDVDDTGNIYVADTWNNRIQKFANDSKTWVATGLMGVEPGNFLDPRDIAASSSHIVAVADTGNFRVQLFDGNLGFTGEIDSDSLNLTPFDFKPVSVSFGPANELFILDEANSRVIVTDDLGNYIRSFGSQGQGSGQFIFPTGINVDDNGKVFVSDRYRIQEF